MSQTWPALTLSEGCGQILRLWPTEKLQNATVGTKDPPFCLSFTLLAPGFYILISRLLDTRQHTKAAVRITRQRLRIPVAGQAK